jgi:hypothetical protein
MPTEISVEIDLSADHSGIKPGAHQIPSQEIAAPRLR